MPNHTISLHHFLRFFEFDLDYYVIVHSMSKSDQGTSPGTARLVLNVGRGRMQKFLRFGAERGCTCARAWSFGFDVLCLLAKTTTLLT